jgi:hypothetical protein
MNFFVFFPFIAYIQWTYVWAFFENFPYFFILAACGRLLDEAGFQMMKQVSS